MTDDEILIRQAVAAEADQAAHPEAVLSRLRDGRRRSPWPRLAIISAAVAAVVAGALVIPSLVRDTPVDVIATQPPPLPATQNILLAGDDGNGNLDTMVLVRVAPDGVLRGVTLPRDTYTEVPGADKRKLGQVYYFALYQAKQSGADDQTAHTTARQTLVDTVQALTGVHVDHVAIADLQAIATLTDAVGGVPICLTDATKDRYSGADFQAGPQTLNGQTALAFLRQRHALPNGDLSRVARAQAFLHGLSQKILPTLTNPQAIDDLAATITRTIRTDPDWDLLAFAATLTTQSTLNTTTIPTLGDIPTPNSGTAMVVVPAGVRRFIAQQLTPPPRPSGPIVSPGEIAPCVN